MARQSTEIDNEDIRNLLTNFEEFHELSGWLQDIMYGAANSGHSRPSSPRALFQALKTLRTISYESVDRFVNTKSRVIDGRVFGRSHVYAFMTRIIYARKAIEHHYERRTGQTIRNGYHISSSFVGDFCYFDGVKRSEIFS